MEPTIAHEAYISFRRIRDAGEDLIRRIYPNQTLRRSSVLAADTHYSHAVNLFLDGISRCEIAIITGTFGPDDVISLQRAAEAMSAPILKALDYRRRHILVKVCSPDGDMPDSERIAQLNSLGISLDEYQLYIIEEKGSSDA